MSDQNRPTPSADPASAAPTLPGVLDLHVHAGPDVRPRTHHYLELAAAAVAAKMAGFVLKDHHHATADRAAECRRQFPSLHVYGGVTLNASVGGLNPDVVERTLRAGGRMVWLPTVDGRGEHIGKGGPHAAGGIDVLDARGQVRPELLAIMRLVAEHDAVLATGHISAREVLAVVRQARARGVKRVLVNHPEIPFLAFPLELQAQLREGGAILEYCYPRPEARDGFGLLAKQIQAVGIDAAVLATDLGRADLPDPITGMSQMLSELRRRGLSDHDLARLTRTNPARLLGLI
jgi:hypothetical protein